MKTLKEYLFETKLCNTYEGLLDVEDTINNNNELIIKFLKDNYYIGGEYTIRRSKSSKFPFEVDVKGDVIVKFLEAPKLTTLTNGLFSFGKVDGKFICNRCKKISSLEGAPKEVGGNFDCGGCGSLKSLEGAPEKVGKYFYCFYCTSLKSLEGSPEKINGDFGCYGCPRLKSLKGAPKEVRGDFDCSECGGKFTKEDVDELILVRGKIFV